MPKYNVNASGIVACVLDGRSDTKCRVTKSTGGSYFLGCCGLGGIESFNYCRGFKNWQEKAEVLACIYRYLYNQGTVLYALTGEQLENPLHLLLLELGAVQIAEFPNLYHGPNMMHLFKVNIRNVAGRYCDKYGKAYTEPPVDDADVIPEQTGPGESGVYQNLPVNY